MSQLLRNIRVYARSVVWGKSDFWIQRTSPFDPAFRDSEEYKAAMAAFPDASDGMVRSAFLSAMDAEKTGRMKAMTWNPYSLPPRRGTPEERSAPGQIMVDRDVSV